MARQRKAEDTELSKLYREGAKVKAAGERFGPAEFQRNHFAYHAAPGTTLERHLDPKFWAPIMAQLRPLDRIEVTEELGAWTAGLIVRSVGTDGVVLGVMTYTEIGGAGPVGKGLSLQPGLKVVFMGAFQKWCCFNGDNLLRAGFPTETAANGWLEDHSRVVNQRGVVA